MIGIATRREKKEPAAITEKDAPASAGFAWVVLASVLLASVAVSLNQFKVPPLMPVLVDALGIDLGQAGLLMSLFALTGLVLTLPAGLIVHRLGPRVTGLAALVCLAAGSAWGALADRFSLLASSRVLEGAGLGLMAVTGPAVIALWFPRERRGLPMGIWAAWFGIGSVLMFNAAPPLEALAGWPAVWWAGAGFALAALCLFGLVVRTPSGSAGNAVPAEGADDRSMMPALAATLANRDVWLLALEFGLFNLVFIGIFTYLPAFLVDERGASLAQAAFVASLITLLGVVSAPLSGWLSDRSGSRRNYIAIPFLVIAALVLVPFQAGGAAIYAFVLLLGAVSGATPAVSFTAVPEVMADARRSAMGIAIVSIGATLGSVLGPVYFGLFVERAGWVNAGYALIPVCLAGFVTAWLVRVR